MKRTKCKSGIEGWTANLQSVYSSFEEFENISDMYGLAAHWDIVIIGNVGKTIRK
jgi:hypothetical protein